MIASAPAWVLVPLTIALLLTFFRLARMRPVLRPLAWPLAGVVLGLAVLIPASRGLRPSPGLSLLVLLPGLVLLVRGAGIVLQGAFRRHQGQPAPALLESVVAVIFYGLGAAAIAHRGFGVELTPFLATSAVVGAVVGLALQDTLGNLFAGIALHIEAPFRVGDWVTMTGTEARVEQVSWRAVRMRTWYGDTVTIPNNEVAAHAISNHSLPRAPHSRQLFIGVSYDAPPNKVLGVLEHLVRQVEWVQKEPAPAFRIVGYGDNHIQYEIRYFIADYEHYRRAEGEIYRLIWYHFRRHGIEIPFPIRTVYLHDASKREGRDGADARLLRALRGIDLFRALTDSELVAAAAAFCHLHYAAGEKIIEEGQAGDSFFVVDRGEVDVSKSVGGKKRSLAHLMEGQCFGEMALLTGEQRSATVEAATDVDVFRLDKAGFETILVPNPEIAEEISALLAERRDALSQAEGDAAAPAQSADEPAERKRRLLTRIRSYFGL